MLSPGIDGISQSGEGACVRSRRKQTEKGVLGMCRGRMHLSLASLKRSKLGNA